MWARTIQLRRARPRVGLAAIRTRIRVPARLPKSSNRRSSNQGSSKQRLPKQRPSSPESSNRRGRSREESKRKPPDWGPQNQRPPSRRPAATRTRKEARDTLRRAAQPREVLRSRGNCSRTSVAAVLPWRGTSAYREVASCRSVPLISSGEEFSRTHVSRGNSGRMTESRRDGTGFHAQRFRASISGLCIGSD